MSPPENGVKMWQRMSAALQSDQPTQTNKLINPFVRHKAEPMVGCKQGMHMTWIGIVQQEMEATLDLPYHCPQSQTGGSSQMSLSPLCKTTTKNQGSLWEVLKIVWLDERGGADY